MKKFIDKEFIKELVAVVIFSSLWYGVSYLTDSNIGIYIGLAIIFYFVAKPK